MCMTIQEAVYEIRGIEYRNALEESLLNLLEELDKDWKGEFYPEEEGEYQQIIYASLKEFDCDYPTELSFVFDTNPVTGLVVMKVNIGWGSCLKTRRREAMYIFNRYNQCYPFFNFSLKLDRHPEEDGINCGFLYPIMHNALSAEQARCYIGVAKDIIHNCNYALTALHRKENLDSLKCSHIERWALGDMAMEDTAD